MKEGDDTELQGLWVKEGLSSGENNLCCIYMLKRGKNNDEKAYNFHSPTK